jgi:hypothetical protein
MKRALLAVIWLFICAIPTICADIDGEWTGTVEGQDGNPLKLTYEFKAEGETLTGIVGIAEHEIKRSPSHLAAYGVRMTDDKSLARLFLRQLNLLRQINNACLQ